MLTTAGESQRFDYIGNVEEFVITVGGLYKLDVWGASGGSGYSAYAINGMGGLGGHSYRYIFLESGSHLFICVGGRGHDNSDLKNGDNKDTDGGYNGGSNGGDNSHNGVNMGGGGGGGASHIAITTNRGELYNYESYQSEILIVAGGGGGGSGYHENPSDPEKDNENYNNKPSTAWDGGHGGGVSGTTNAIGCGTYGQVDDPASYAGISTSFGKGCYRNYPYAGGGGGGWYGGYHGGQEAPGAGGTGYIGAPSFVYKGTVYENYTETGINNGNGSALITLVHKATPSVYLGTKNIVSIYYGTHDITDIKIFN